MSPVEILRGARGKISEPRHWAQGDFARDIEGNPVSFASSDAVCWCARGAIYATDEFDSWGAIQLLRRAIEEQTGDPAVARFNDTHGHTDVLAVFDRAIELAEAQS